MLLRKMFSKLLEEKPLVLTALMSKVSKYFEDEEHEKEFEIWYERKYGKQYKRS